MEFRGCLEKPDENGEIPLLIGHYSIININNPTNKINPKIVIYGLGSCIALILMDKKNRVGGMSHILLPKAHPQNIITYPHKYAELSVKLLYKELVDIGAEKNHIAAIVVGGSRIFNLNENKMGVDNSIVVKDQLSRLKIRLLHEELGGSRGRGVIFDTNDFSVSVKFSGESNYRLLI